ncbi:helix-turn-helix transcriptional regulator [Limnobacter humi]|uniref:Helix-turn-helix transcriptional regulator n=1 Tax=Limnobacter humi TaxID=1778671 RepID=A0ABT1WH39_9BURK|nr:helix-turn-helix domain-containing protein [Limnobacter humi]MCQ8896832.1 helix-turn-helix transcriptional regulator [Limnobacter humi]
MSLHTQPSPLKHLRQHQRISQAELAHRVGVSQRHLSCIETAKAHPSREMLTAILDALQLPMGERNQCLVHFGYAPAHPHRPLHDKVMAPVRQVIELLLSKHAPYPAIVLDADWNLVQFNGGVLKLLELLDIPVDALQGQPNLLGWMIGSDGLLSHIINIDEVMPYLVRRLQSEAAHLPHLRPLLASVPRPWQTQARSMPPIDTPVLVTRFRSRTGDELAFMTTITTFGTPIDITVESIRVELLYPVNEAAQLAFQTDNIHPNTTRTTNIGRLTP